MGTCKVHAKSYFYVHRGVQIFHSRSTLNTSRSTAIFGDRCSMIAIDIVSG